MKSSCLLQNRPESKLHIHYTRSVVHQTASLPPLNLSNCFAILPDDVLVHLANLPVDAAGNSHPMHAMFCPLLPWPALATSLQGHAHLQQPFWLLLPLLLLPLPCLHPLLPCCLCAPGLGCSGRNIIIRNTWIFPGACVWTFVINCSLS